VALHQGCDEALAHRIFAGGEATLVSSRFEPCGLTQMYALRYGSLPLVRRTGGLTETAVDCTLEDLGQQRATGFVFERFDADDLRRAPRRAFTLWQRPRDGRAVRARAMEQRFGWDAAASQLAPYRAARPVTAAGRGGRINICRRANPLRPADGRCRLAQRTVRRRNRATLLPRMSLTSNVVSPRETKR
jgi:hypothetical protein